MISLILSRAFKNPGITPYSIPAKIPAIAMAASIRGRGVVFGKRNIATAVAAQAPRNICPSAPIFQSFIRKAITHARPVSMMGEAFTSVSEKGPKHCRPFGQSVPANKACTPAAQSAGVPKPSLNISIYVPIGSVAPAARITKPPTTNARRTPTIAEITPIQAGRWERDSILNR